MFKKIILFILLITALSVSNLYAYSAKTELRVPLSGSIDRIGKILGGLGLDKEIFAPDYNCAEFTEAQRQEIIEEMKKYCGSFFKNALLSLEKLEQSEAVTYGNKAEVFIILKEIPEVVRLDTCYVYDNLIVLLKSQLVTKFNIKEILRDFLGTFKDIFHYSEADDKVSKSLAVLLGSGLITETNQKEIFAVLREISRVLKGGNARDAYVSLREILGSIAVMEEDDQREILTVFKEILAYARNKSATCVALSSLLELNIMRENNQPEVINFLKKVLRNPGCDTVGIYRSLEAFLKLEIDLETNPDEMLSDFSNIIMEICLHVYYFDDRAYNNLINLFESRLITKANQKSIFSILQEIPQHAEVHTYEAYDKLKTLLKTLKSNYFAMDHFLLANVLYMIKTGGIGNDVAKTIDSINDFVLIGVKESIFKTNAQPVNSLTALFDFNLTQKFPSLEIYSNL